MCGIAGIFISTKAKQDRWSRLQRKRILEDLIIQIEQRGKDATGVAMIDKGSTWQLEKQPVRAGDFLISGQWRKMVIKPSTWAILAHTRLATQGTPKNPLNNHPLRRGEVVITHNGGINNDVQLRRKYRLNVAGAVDSGTLAGLLNMRAWNEKNIKKTLEEIRGPAAVAAVNLNIDNSLLISRHTRPLFIAADPARGELWWASQSRYLEFALRGRRGWAIMEVPEGYFRLFRDQIDIESFDVGILWNVYETRDVERRYQGNFGVSHDEQGWHYGDDYGFRW